MCGIAGVVGTRDPQLIKKMTAALYHRGPDDEGYFSNEDIDLGARRLSIIDLDEGQQPIYNETRDKCVIFNGEIYNYRELRQSLIRQGHHFTTATDTEVIIHLYETYGERCVEHLRGMFAFAIADGKKLFIARDRFGIKPLYYAFLKAQGLFLFASEIKALLRCPALTVNINQEMLCHVAILGHAFGNETYFEGVESLPPGHCMWIEREGPELTTILKPYYKLSLDGQAALTFDEAAERLHLLLADAVHSHLVADVDIGLTLSGGIDSTLLALEMARHYAHPISSFTISDTPDNPDIHSARVVAENIHSEHLEVLTNFEDSTASIPQYMLAEEQPSSLFGLPLFLLCRQIGRQVKVCINGEGADELFGGYSDYLERQAKVNRLQTSLAKVKTLGLTPRAELIEYISLLSAAQTDEEYLAHLFPFNLSPQLVHNHLHVVDKYAMASSLEMRVPFLDNTFVEFSNSLPIAYKVNVTAGIKKYILKKVAIDSYGEITINAVLRKKVGFPSSGWGFLTEFNKYCETALPDHYAERHEMKSYYTFSDAKGTAISKRALILYDLFHLIFIEQRGSIPEGFDFNQFMRGKAHTS